MANSTFNSGKLNFYILVLHIFVGYSSIPRSPAFSTKPFEKHHFQRTLIALLRPLPRETLRHTATCLRGEKTSWVSLGHGLLNGKIHGERMVKPWENPSFGSRHTPIKMAENEALKLFNIQDSITGEKLKHDYLQGRYH